MADPPVSPPTAFRVSCSALPNTPIPRWTHLRQYQRQPSTLEAARRACRPVRQDLTLELRCAKTGTTTSTKHIEGTCGAEQSTAFGAHVAAAGSSPCHPACSPAHSIPTSANPLTARATVERPVAQSTLFSPPCADHPGSPPPCTGQPAMLGTLPMSVQPSGHPCTSRSAMCCVLCAMCCVLCAMRYVLCAVCCVLCAVCYELSMRYVMCAM